MKRQKQNRDYKGILDYVRQKYSYAGITALVVLMIVAAPVVDKLAKTEVWFFDGLVAQMDGEMPPPDGGGAPPPVNDGGAPPPPSDDGGMPPPVDDGGAPPPPSDDGGMPPPVDDSGAPPPPSDDGGMPPPPVNDGGAPPPPSDDGGMPPPPVDDSGAPPPPSDDGGMPPPPVDDGGMTSPPSDDQWEDNWREPGEENWEEPHEYNDEGDWDKPEDWREPGEENWEEPHEYNDEGDWEQPEDWREPGEENWEEPYEYNDEGDWEQPEDWREPGDENWEEPHEYNDEGDWDKPEDWREPGEETWEEPREYHDEGDWEQPEDWREPGEGEWKEYPEEDHFDPAEWSRNLREMSSQIKRVKREKRYLDRDKRHMAKRMDKQEMPEELKNKFEEILSYIDNLISEYDVYLAEAQAILDNLEAEESGDTRDFWDLWQAFEEAHPRSLLEQQRFHLEFYERTHWLVDFFRECEKLSQEMERASFPEEDMDDVKTHCAEVQSFYDDALVAFDEVRNFSGDPFDLEDLMFEARWALEEIEDPWRFLEEYMHRMGEMDHGRFMKDGLYGIGKTIKWVVKRMQEFEEQGADLNEVWPGIAKIKELYEIASLKFEEGEFEEAEHFLRQMEEVGDSLDNRFDKVARQYPDLPWESFFREMDKRTGGPRDMQMDDFGMENSDKLDNVLTHIDKKDIYQAVEVILKANPEILNGLMEESDEKNEEYIAKTLQMISHVPEKHQANYLEKKQQILGKISDIDAQIAALEQKKHALADELGDLRSLKDEIAGYNFVGEAGDEIQTEIDDFIAIAQDANASTEEIKDKIKDLKTKAHLKMEKARNQKLKDGLISFKDADDNQWFFEYVEEAKREGIVSGYEDVEGNDLKEYRPANNVTLAESLKMSLETAGVGQSFGDPSQANLKDHWSKGYAKKAEELGLSIAQKSYDPNAEASRGEVIRLSLEALGVKPPKATQSHFADVSLDDPNIDFINYAYENDLISGDDRDDGTRTFRPFDSINRAEVAKVTAKVMEHKNVTADEKVVSGSDMDELVDFFEELETEEAVELELVE